jgi:hypothetical protein
MPDLNQRPTHCPTNSGAHLGGYKERPRQTALMTRAVMRPRGALGAGATMEPRRQGWPSASLAQFNGPALGINSPMSASGAKRTRSARPTRLVAVLHRADAARSSVASSRASRRGLSATVPSPSHSFWTSQPYRNGQGAGAETDLHLEVGRDPVPASSAVTDPGGGNGAISHSFSGRWLLQHVVALLPRVSPV